MRIGRSRIGEGDGVDGIELVLVVEVGVEAVHHHARTPASAAFSGVPCRRARGLGRLVGMARGIGVDDEGAVHALVDVPLQRQRVAVIEVAAEGRASNS